ncbi:MAG: 5-(carboxyamino)imidazole ribonucleotide synthase [Bacteroidia bacterium]|jgi:5-(carboxyamino)imidazole ribonucleotide synthase
MTQPFKTTIGIIGGGQLGKMLIESAKPWNVSFNILEASTDCPCYAYADTFIEGSLMDAEKIKALAQISDVITYEIEHVDVATLKYLEAQGTQVIPSAHILEIIQDKGKQKAFYKQHALASSHYILTDPDQAKMIDLSIFDGDQVVVKSCRGGYDGKGVSIMSKTSITNGTLVDVFKGEVIIEAFVPDVIELSVIVARNSKGVVKSFPMVEMVFDPTMNLVDYLFAPSAVSSEITEDATTLAHNAIQALEGVGIFAVELFLTQDKTCLINEIAPRPHNSGHHTIEANYTSQYEQLMRIMLELPLGNTDLITPAVMTNIVGSADVVGDYKLEGIDELMSTPGAYLHWYNKSVSKPGRKMGHFTVLDKDLNAAIEKSHYLKSKLKTAQL